MKYLKQNQINKLLDDLRELEIYKKERLDKIGENIKDEVGSKYDDETEIVTEFNQYPIYKDGEVVDVEEVIEKKHLSELIDSFLAHRLKVELDLIETNFDQIIQEKKKTIFQERAKSLKTSFRTLKKSTNYSLQLYKYQIIRFEGLFSSTKKRITLLDYNQTEDTVKDFVDELQKKGFIYPSDYQKALDYFLNGKHPGKPIKFQKAKNVFRTFRINLESRIGIDKDYLLPLFGKAITLTSKGKLYKEGTKSEPAQANISSILEALRKNTSKK